MNGHFQYLFPCINSRRIASFFCIICHNFILRVRKPEHDTIFLFLLNFFFGLAIIFPFSDFLSCVHFYVVSQNAQSFCAATEGMGKRNPHQVCRVTKIQELGFELLRAILALRWNPPYKYSRDRLKSCMPKKENEKN